MSMCSELWTIHFAFVSLHLFVCRVGTTDIKQANEELSQVHIQGLEERTACVDFAVDLAISDPCELGASGKLLVQI